MYFQDRVPRADRPLRAADSPDSGLLQLLQHGGQPGERPHRLPHHPLPRHGVHGRRRHRQNSGGQPDNAHWWAGLVLPLKNFREC